MLIDFHVHSSKTQEDSYPVSEVAQQAKQKGLDGICLTDVHTAIPAAEAKEAAQAAGILILTGFEAISDQGHYLVFLPDPDELGEFTGRLPLDEEGRLSFPWLTDAVASRQGILIAAHPFDRKVPGSPGDSLVRLTGVTAVEVLNASRPQLVNELAEEIAAGAGLPGVGGSDGRGNLDLLGRFATLVRGPLNHEADLIERVKSFDVWPVAIGKPAFATARPSHRGRERRDGQRRDRSNGRSERSGGSRGDHRRSNARGPKGGSRHAKGQGRSHRRGRGKPKPPKPD